ncbi:hypothetical protein LX64_01178 [Chitinophaga skermanii]|uniref:Uncharacterized protein n=1 Tax=Chitinophaga skermanii TaxID=331697 RepID=A0A327QX34_9BACT|nr:hypothetical protein [Chitinophaga skermanii]RAJ08525.1 hypothetical protein LX64_01178 [Chitinophaga skermanii]
MKRYLLLLLLLAANTSWAFAQPELQENNRVQLPCRILLEQRVFSGPLYIVQLVNPQTNKIDSSFELDVKSFSLIDTAKILSMEVKKSSDALSALYGSRAVNGVILITMPSTTQFLTFDDLLFRYKIPRKYHSLPLCVNNRLVESSERFIADASVINNVQVTKEIYSPEIIRDPQQLYLNITTLPPKKRS